MIVNMSVWESLAALRDFTYRSITFDFFEIARKWFVKMDKPSYCPVSYTHLDVYKRQERG